MTRAQPLNVFLTVDTEIWCDGWDALDAAFPSAFQKYIYGRTPQGDFGLPFMLKVLSDNGLKAVFYVEPMFTLRFGLDPLVEIVELIQGHGQAVDLHLHTEWLDEAKAPLLDCSMGKRQHIRQFSFDDQCLLLGKGIELLKRAGATAISSYRAGNFGANNDTLRALATTDIKIDSSYNPATSVCEIVTDSVMHQAGYLDGVLEVPMNVFTDGLGKMRPATITACSLSEMKAALFAALEADWDNLVFLTHSFELLNDARTRRNSIVSHRFVKFCEFLGAHRKDFKATDFGVTAVSAYDKAAHAISCGIVPTISRLGEQVLSRAQ